MVAPRLFFTASVEEQWRALVGPWLRELARTAWKNPKPTVVLTPSRAEGFYLRSRLVEESISFLGLRFWTPSDARKFLLSELSPETLSTTQAELRLLARICAERLLLGANPPEPATLTSVVREPGPFLRAYDLLLGAGWNPTRDGAPYGRALAGEIGRELQKRKLATQAGLHRQLLHHASTQDKQLIAHLLIVGFNATHWPLWDLLRASLLGAEQAVLALSQPRTFAEEIDQLWISSWEEGTQSEAINPISPILQDERNLPFASLVASYEKGSPGDSTEASLSFLVTPGLASQVRAVVLQALDYLKNDSCTRLGIAFPEANALALGVAGELRRLGIAFDDGTGASQPGIFEQRFWQAWLAWQKEPSVQNFIAWLRACDAGKVSCGLENPALSVRKVADVLDNALGESLVDHLDFLARQLDENSSGRNNAAVATFLRSRIKLPPEASFANFLTLTRQTARELGWHDHLAQLQIDPPKALLESDVILSRKIFLEWLKESTDSRQRVRGADGNHFYGKVHLVIVAQMTGQTWSHLILTGLNEGHWPRIFEDGAFGSRYELATLNRQARSLNREGTEQGRQGIGHETVRADHGHCLLPLEQHDLALRDLCAAIEGTSAAVCLTAMTTEAGRSLLPSDFFNHAYQAKTGHILDEATFQNLALATSRWCHQHEPFFATQTEATTPSLPIAETLLAYQARRDAYQPFGPYEFAYRTPPASPIQLSCKTWETAWNHPASVWLGKIVGVSEWPQGALAWSRAVGTWAHRWLGFASRTCRERNSANDFLSLLREAADCELYRAQDRARTANIDLYPWWEHVWGQAKSLALGLGTALAPHLPDKQFLSEFRLPDHLLITLPGTTTADFALRGRIDLLLVEPGATPCNPSQGDFSGCACWVIDFKTGSAQSLNAGKIEKGIGLQALLYAMAVRARGARATDLSLHTIDTPLKRQVGLDAALESESLFRSLDLLHRAGIFGMRPGAENDYGYAPSYPMATRQIPALILEAKWALVHGAESPDEEDAE